MLLLNWGLQHQGGLPGRTVGRHHWQIGPDSTIERQGQGLADLVHGAQSGGDRHQVPAQSR